jgi:DNA-binding response OmpR family regulator
VLRRSSQQVDDLPSEELSIGPFMVDFRSHEVRLHGKLVDLTPKEFKILETLMREPGRVFSRLELVKRVFGMDYEGFERTVDVHIMNLRKKIEPHPNEPVYLQTVYGVGYKFRREET